MTTTTTCPASYGRCLAVFLLLTGLCMVAASQARAQDLKQTFASHDPQSEITVDHSAWDALLQSYVVEGANGLNLVDYARQGLAGAHGPVGVVGAHRGNPPAWMTKNSWPAWGRFVPPVAEPQFAPRNDAVASAGYSNWRPNTGFAVEPDA